MNKPALSGLILLLLLSSCISKEEDYGIDEGDVYFQVEYLNHAWGYQHHGFIIDQQGNLFGYEKPEGWVFPEEGVISPRDFRSNLNKAEKETNTIPATEVKQMEPKALLAKNGELTEPESQMVDAGTTVFAVFIFDKKINKLKKYDLLWEGDLFRENNSQAAKDIAAWLKEIRNSRLEH